MTYDEFKALVRNVKRVRITPNTWQLPSGPVERMHIELDTWLFMTDDGRGLYECVGGLLGRPQISAWEFSITSLDLSTEDLRVRARKSVRAQLKKWLNLSDRIATVTSRMGAQ